MQVHVQTHSILCTHVECTVADAIRRCADSFHGIVSLELLPTSMPCLWCQPFRAWYSRHLESKVWDLKGEYLSWLTPGCGSLLWLRPGCCGYAVSLSCVGCVLLILLRKRVYECLCVNQTAVLDANIFFFTPEVDKIGFTKKHYLEFGPILQPSLQPVS